MKRIVVAGGCFWGVEAYFKKVKGIEDTNCGYTNGNMEHPTYEDLIKHRATHAEAVELYYDEKTITLEKILEHLFRIIDPTSRNRQGGDIGIQYRTGVYYQDLDDLAVIRVFIATENQKYNGRVAVEVEKEVGFTLAEAYHQDYLDQHPTGYCHVNMGLLKKEEMKD